MEPDLSGMKVRSSKLLTGNATGRSRTVWSEKWISSYSEHTFHFEGVGLIANQTYVFHLIDGVQDPVAPLL